MADLATESTMSTAGKSIRWFLTIMTVAAIVTAPSWSDQGTLRLSGEIMIFLALAILWNLLAGYAGLVSVGQQAFVGLGGYTLFVLCGFFGLSPYMAIPLAMTSSAIAAAVFAPLLFRLDGAYFAIGTWVAAETVLLSFSLFPALGGGAGMSLPIASVKAIAASKMWRDATVFWLICGVGLGTLVGTYGLLRSRAGLALMAVRDNGLAAASLGIDIWRTRFFTYVAVAAVTGGLGAVIFLQKLRISPASAFSLNDWTVMVIFAVVIGGIGRLEGAIVGTIVYFLLREILAGYGPVYMLVLGAIAIAVMLFSKGGLWEIVTKWCRWTPLPTDREP